MEDELDLIIQNMVSAGESEDNIALVINSYNSEKKKPTPTATPPKSVSGTPTGSSAGVNPAFKSSIPSPIPDFNSVGKKPIVTPEVKYKEGTVAWNHQKMIENNPDYVSNYDKFKQVKNVSDAKKAEIAQENEDEFNGVGIWNNVKSFGKDVVNSTLQGLSTLADIHPDDKKEIKVETDPFADQKAKAKKEFQEKVLLAKKNKEAIPVFTSQDINQRAKEIKLQERIDSQSETQIKDFLQKDNETGGSQKNKFQSFEIGNYATIQEKDKVLLEQQNIERNVIKGLEGELKELEVKLTENGLSPENLKLYKEKNNSLNTIKSEYEKADSDFKNSDQYKNYIKKSEELKPIDAKYKSINAELEKAKLDIEDAKKNKDSKKENELITIYNQKVKELNSVREQYNSVYEGVKDNSFIENYNKNIEAIRSRYNNAYKEVNALSKTANKNNQVSVEYNNKYKKYQEVIAESIDTHNKYVSNRKNLGSATENLDIFKRDYGSLKSFIGNINAVSRDLAAGVVGAVDYALEAKKNILGYQTANDIYAQKIAQGVVVNLKSDSDKVRAEIMKPITVDNINNLSDLGDWFFQTAVAQQIPIYGLIATGGIGVGAIGVSSGGQRLNDMRGEMERGEKQYTDKELMLHPVGFAIAETASAAVDLMILKNAARVIASATRPERQMIASGFANRAMKIGGVTARGGVYEGVDEGLTKGAENLIEGKPFTEGMKDPIAAGAVMGMLIPFGANLFAEATKPFSTDTKIQEASAEILNLQNELDKPNLSTETRDLIKDNLAKTQSKVEVLMKKQIGKIESLSKEQFQEIIKNEKTQANIKKQAESIQLDENISTETKKQLLSNLKAEFKAQNERRIDLLARGASVQMERLTPTESIRLKDLAQKRLMKEQNPDGTKNITLEDEEISRTAIQIYNAEVKENNLRNERDKELADREKVKTQANEQIPTPKAQPQAEVPQQAEAEKVEEKNGKFYVKVSEGLTLGFATKEEAQAKLDSIQGKAQPQAEAPQQAQADKVNSETENKIADIQKRRREELLTVDNRDANIRINDSSTETINGFIENYEKSIADKNYGSFTEAELKTRLNLYKKALEVSAKYDAELEALNQATPPVEGVVAASVAELDIKIERGGVFSGEFLNDYDFLAEGSEHTVYRSKDGETVIKIGEPYNSNEGYQARVDDAININRLLGDGSLEVIGTYRSPNGTINPVYKQNFTDGKVATQEQVAEHLTNNGFTQTGNDTFTINQNGKTLEISDTSDNFIINSNGDIIAIDAAIREIQNEATPPTDTPANGNVRPTATNVGESGITEQESPAKEGVLQPVDGGEGKGDASVEKNSIFGSMENTAKALDETDNKGLVKLIKDVIFHGTASKFKEFKITNISSGAIKIPNTIFFTNNETRAFSFSKSAKNNIIDDIHRIMWWGNKEAMFNTKSNIDSNLNNNNDISKKALKDLNEYFKSIGHEDLGLKTKADISKLINKIESGELETSRVIGVKIKEGAKTLVIDNNKDWQSILANYKFGDSKGSLKKIYQKYDVLIHKNTTDFPLSGNKELMDKSRLGDNIIVLNPKFIQNIDSQYISEQYHKAKADGTNPELVKAVEDAIGKPAETPQPKSKGDVEVGGKSVSLPNLDDIADFINQTYLNDGKQENKPTAEADKGAKKNSVDENSEKPASEGKAKKISLKGRTPLSKRKFRGDRAKASNIEVTDEHSLVLNHFVTGGKISSDYVQESLSEGDKKAKNNSFNGIASKSGKGIDALAHDLWEGNHNLDIAKIKESIEDVVRSHDTVQDITDTILKTNDVSPEKTPEEYADDYANHYEVKEEQKASDKVMQEAESSLDQLSDAEIIELADSQEKSYDDFLKDLEKRQVTFDWFAFVDERGTIQNDGSILNDKGEFFAKEDVSNVKQLYPDPKEKAQAKTPISKDTPELKEVNTKLEKANEKLRVAKDALDRKAKLLDKELLKDNEDIFGERKNQNENKLFDERADGNARNKATEKERKAIIDAQNEIKSLKEAKAKIESGEIVSTSKMDFEAKKKVDLGVEKPTDVGKMISASSRFRPAQRVDFEKPIIGKNGSKLVSYQWAYEWTEQPNRQGELKPKRISNWDQAESSASTGRDIVHQFTIEKPNGEIITVSSESVPFELGYAEKSQMKDLPSLVSAVKTLAKNKMKLAILEAQLQEYKDLKAKYQKIIPEIKEIKEPTNFSPEQEAYSNGEYKVFAIEDVWVRQSNKYNDRTKKFDPIDTPDKFTILSVKEDWVNKRVKEDGGKFPRDIVDLRTRVQRQEKKIGLVNSKEIDAKQQLKEKANAEVDRIAQQVKDLLPGINDPDLYTQGFSQDQLIDLIATAVKKLIGAGIDINEAIKQVVDSVKAKFGEIDIDIDVVKQKINPKAEEKEADNDFKSKSGKKSLLGRLIEGGNPDVITKAVKELGENYDVRNQEEANDEAMAFIDKVGASEALKAIKDGLITNSDVKMLIYDEAITRLKTEISDEMNNNPEDREALIKKFQEVSDEFDRAIRDAGQGIAIMNYIYNKNQTLKYNLAKQINDWKRNDPNGEIPADVKAKFEELNQKLKDVEERTKDAEERAKKAEDELAIKNIKEDVERKNQAARKNKSGLTPQEQTRKKQLRDKFARANDVTGIPALLVDPEFREYLGLVLKTAKGDFANFSNEILKDLGKTARQHLPELFANAGGKGDVKVTDLQSITISKEGKIKIPAQMLRDYVEQGYTDIDEIAALIKDDIADEFPDADLKDIRDALTGYGKQINPNKDEITAQVNKLKEYGRLLSAYDDVMNRQMPKKSGLVRPKSEQKARELRRNINRLAKELNLEQVDTEKQWANAIDKVKTHLKNQIEDLDKQIANGEKRKIDRTPIKLDEEATALKTIRDAKKQILDDLVGKPEMTEEQKIASAEKSLETSIKKIQEEINTNDIAFKEKPTAVTSKKIEELKAIKKALLESKKQLRQEAGLIEQQRLKTAKTRVKNQIEDLNNKIKNKDFAKKEIKPILADNELNTLRAEKEAVYEEFEKMKYLQELKNRTFAKKMMDEGLEALGLARAIKASLDLGLIGIQLRGFTYSELWRNPKELGRKFVKMFGAIGSQNKTNKAMSELIGHPLHSLAKKLDIGMTHPDLRNEVREEMASGNLLHFIWSSPILAAEKLGAKQFMNSKRSSIGDSFVNAAKAQYNKLFQNYQVDIKQKDKFTIKEQWKNINAFEAVERGLSVYGNQLRFEEFVRGVDRLKAEGKDEINHLEDYKLLASYIRTFSGRAKPAGFELNQKALNVFFFSFKNMASIIQQLNPVYYMLQHGRSTDFKNGNYFKPSVANKMAMTTMFKSVTSTAATLLFIMATYNAFKDDDEEEATIETDPTSSDFGKLKIGTFRADPWGGYTPLISLYARLYYEEVKKSDGTVVKFGEGFGGIQNRGDAATRFLINKESPGFQMFHKYMTSTVEVDKITGETKRVTPYGSDLSEEDAYSFYPIFMGSVKEAKEKDYEGTKAFLTAYSVLGLLNVQDYESKAGATPEETFLKSQDKKKAQFDLPESEKEKIRVDDKLSRVESKIKMIDEIKIAQKLKLPYYISKDVYLTKEEVADMDLESGSQGIEQAKKDIKAIKLKYKIKD